MSPPSDITPDEIQLLADQLPDWAAELGFEKVRITGTDVKEELERFKKWLASGMHGTMEYLERPRNVELRGDPTLLLEERALSIISVRMRYATGDVNSSWKLLRDGSRAYISRFALGRDYHKVIRKRLHRLATRIEQHIGPFGYRAFTDSAPILEKALAHRAGIGWRGKHSLILERDAGSFFFLGELLTNLPLPFSAEEIPNSCGGCTSCIDVCPTQAIVAPGVVDARRCISYLTIENRGSIPEELRKPMGNRIFGCDDCQLICPWNRHAVRHAEPDFEPRHSLDNIELIELFGWSEEHYLKKTEGSSLRRSTYVGWLRNIAVALGNAPTSEKVITALESRLNYPNEMVREHIRWALSQHTKNTRG